MSLVRFQDLSNERITLAICRLEVIFESFFDVFFPYIYLFEACNDVAGRRTDVFSTSEDICGKLESSPVINVLD
jgi:hypothetical protein